MCYILFSLHFTFERGNICLYRKKLEIQINKKKKGLEITVILPPRVKHSCLVGMYSPRFH